MAIKLQVRRDTAVNWTTANPVLLQGELGFEIDTGKLKIGRDVSQNWNTIPYVGGTIPSHVHNITDINNFSENIQAEITTFLQGSTEITINHDVENDVLIFDLANTLSTDKIISGKWAFNVVSFYRNAKGNVSGTVSLDVSTSNYFTFTLIGNTTIEIANSLSGDVVQTMGMKITNGGAFTITWPASFHWAGGVEPTLTTAGVDLLTFLSDDNGVSWINIGEVLDATV